MPLSKTESITSPFAIVSFEEEVIGNPSRYLSSLSQEDYNNLRTTTFTTEDGFIEIHYVAEKCSVYKKVEKYRIREELINPKNLTLAYLWTRLMRRQKFDHVDYQSLCLFDIFIMENKLFEVFSKIPAGFKIGYIAHLKSRERITLFDGELFIN